MGCIYYSKEAHIQKMMDLLLDLCLFSTFWHAPEKLCFQISIFLSNLLLIRYRKFKENGSSSMVSQTLAFEVNLIDHGINQFLKDLASLFLSEEFKISELLKVLLLILFLQETWVYYQFLNEEYKILEVLILKAKSLRIW